MGKVARFMSIITVEECPQCGASVNLSLKHCEYCGSKFIVSNLSYLEGFNREGIDKYLRHYKKLHRSHQDDAEVNISLGLCYLNLGLFDLAKKHFETVIDFNPEYSDSYYFMVLSMMKKRKPMNLKLKEVKTIEEYLNAAILLDDQNAKYYYLLAIIKYEYYYKNGLKMVDWTFEELIEKGKSCFQDTAGMNTLLSYVSVNDKSFLSEII